MSSKILGPESDFFAEMAVDAVTAVRTESGGDLGKKARNIVEEKSWCFRDIPDERGKEKKVSLARGILDVNKGASWARMQWY